VHLTLAALRTQSRETQRGHTRKSWLFRTAERLAAPESRRRDQGGTARLAERVPFRELKTRRALASQRCFTRFRISFLGGSTKRFSVKSASGPFLEVVGVAADGKYIFIAESPQPYFYRPLAQDFQAFRTLQIRTSVRPESLIASVEQEIGNLAPDLPIFNAETMEQLLEGGNGFMVFHAGAERAGEMFSGTPARGCGSVRRGVVRRCATDA